VEEVPEELNIQEEVEQFLEEKVEETNVEEVEAEEQVKSIR
jgi:hypothetical protein